MSDEWPGPDGRDLMAEAIDLMAAGHKELALHVARESNRRFLRLIEARAAVREGYIRDTRPSESPSSGG